jgi:hypothetical protein
LVNVDLLGQCCCIIAAQIPATVGSDADAKVADSDFQLGVADYVGDCTCDAWVNLDRAVCRSIGLVVETDEENAGNER